VARPPAIDRHLADLERFFTEDESGDTPEWQFGDGRDFNARRAVKSVRRYIRQLEAQAEGLRVPEWTIIQSCRYGFSRRSYALGMTCDHLRDVWPRLSEDTRVVVRRDLDQAIDDANWIDGPHRNKHGLRVLTQLRDDLQAKETA
jgi:hypothetical protein